MYVKIETPTKPKKQHIHCYNVNPTPTPTHNYRSVKFMPHELGYIKFDIFEIPIICSCLLTKQSYFVHVSFIFFYMLIK